MIGDIPVFVVEIRKGRVKLGVDAPKDVPVHRSEVDNALMHGESRKPPAVDGGKNGNGRSRGGSAAIGNV